MISQKRLPILYVSILVILLLMLSACGGGSGGSGGSGGGTVENVLEDSSKLQISTVVTLGGAVEPSSVAIDPNTSVLFDIVPDEGFEVVAVSGCPGTLVGDDAFQTDELDADCLLTVEFQSVRKELTVSVFGDGIVEFGADLVCARGQECKAEFDVGEELLLQAIPGPGWELLRWNGCDSEIGNSCNISVIEDRLVAPTFARVGPPQLHDKVYQLSSVDLDKIESIEDGSIVFSAGASDIVGMEVGNILVSTRGEGFARRITKIIALPDTPVFLQTTNVPVSEVIHDTTISWSEQIDTSMVKSFDPASNVRVKGIQQKGKVIDLTVEIDLENGASLSGSIFVDLKPSFDLDMGFLKVEEFRIALGGSFGTALKAAFRAPLDNYKIEKEVPLGQIVLAPIPLGAVIVVPKISLIASLTGDLSAGITISANAQLSGVFGRHYLDGNGWRTIKSVSASGGLENIQTDVTARLTKAQRTRTTFLLYGLVGPYAEVGPYTSLWIGVVGDPITGESCTSWGGTVGISAHAGGIVDLVGWKFATPPISVSIEGPSFGPGPGLLPLSQCPVRSRQAPQSLDVKQIGAQSTLVSWESPAGDPVFFYGLFKDGKLLKVVRGTEYTDFGLDPGQSVCYSVMVMERDGSTSPESSECLTLKILDQTDPTPPSQPSISDITTGALTVTWKSATDDTAISHYVVSQDGVTKYRTSDLNIRLTQLDANTQFCFDIAAVDTSGNESSTVQACAKTLPTGAGKWRMQIACVGRAFQLENNLDLDASNDGVINVLNRGADYDGTRLTYTLSGRYNFETSLFDAQITYAFEGHSHIRKDVFVADLSSEDTGRITMDQVRVTGCTTAIRFSKAAETSAAGKKLINTNDRLFNEY